VALSDGSPAPISSDSGVRLVGVDGGGSGVRAAIVERLRDGCFARRGELFSHTVSPGSDATSWIEAAADVIARCAAGAERVRFGMGMPGRKTDDGRGIAHALHGPVEPRFLERLEDVLARRGVELVAGCERLEDDGLLGCAGELFGVNGGLRGARTGYFIGGGTGLAEAFVFEGAVVAFEDAPKALERAWRLTDGAATFEERLSVRGLNQRYRAAGGTYDRPEEGAHAGEEAASRVLIRAVWDLVRLVWLREQALATGFDRVVVSQRLACVLTHAAVRPIVDETLAQVAERGGDDRLKDRLVLSTSPAAAVVGAAAGGWWA
jgi:hypothetical protein